MSDPTPDPNALPLDPQAFWTAGDAALPRGAARDQELPLRRLGPSPFTGSGFPVLGLLETVYEHVMERTRARWQTPDTGADDSSAQKPSA